MTGTNKACKQNAFEPAQAGSIIPAYEIQKVTHLSRALQIVLAKMGYLVLSITALEVAELNKKRAYDFAAKDIVFVFFYRFSTFSVCPGISDQVLSATKLF